MTVRYFRDKATGLTTFRFTRPFRDRPAVEYEELAVVGPQVFRLTEQWWDGIYRTEIVSLLHGKVFKFSVPLRVAEVAKALELDPDPRRWRTIGGGGDDGKSD